MRTHNPETAAALQILYHACDGVNPVVRMTLFHAISHLTGKSLLSVINIWESTR